MRAGMGDRAWDGNRDIVCWKTYWAAHRPRSRWGMLRLYFQYLDAEVYCRRPGVAVTGFKLMYNQASTELGVLAYLSVHNVSIVHLIRGNYLDAVLSEETSAARGVSRRNRFEARRAAGGTGQVHVVGPAGRRRYRSEERLPFLFQFARPLL